MADNLVDAYWETVHLCLTDLHGVESGVAQSHVQRLRQWSDLDDTISPPSIQYHAEPFDVACAVAGRELDVRAFMDVYRAIRTRSRLSDPHLPFVPAGSAGTPMAAGGAQRPSSPGAHGEYRPATANAEQST